MVRGNFPALRLSGIEGTPPGAPGEHLARLEAPLLATPVLVVEDEAMIAWMMENLLEDMGFTAISIAATGEEAIEQAARLSPGLVISDINLGQNGMDGVDAAVAIRKDADLSIVFITGYASAEARDRIARDLPGAHLLRKPVDVEDLRRAIVQTIARRGSN